MGSNRQELVDIDISIMYSVKLYKISEVQSIKYYCPIIINPYGNNSLTISILKHALTLAISFAKEKANVLNSIFKLYCYKYFMANCLSQKFLPRNLPDTLYRRDKNNYCVHL